jgi:hypothetical protein
MIATVQLSIDYIGGHSLVGPINRLQNAVSFNYYANTEMYDVRSDTIVDGKIKNGIKLGQLKENLIGKDKVKTIYGNLKTQDTINQVKEDKKNTDTDQVESDNPIEIKIEDGNIIAKTKAGGKPSVTNPTDKENSANDKNELKLQIKVGSQTEDFSENIETISKPTSLFTKLVTPDEIKKLDLKITTAENELTTAKLNFEISKNPTTKNALKVAEKNLKESKRIKETELKGKETKIKVEAYFTKNKGKTKVQKDFTVTANGIN